MAGRALSCSCGRVVSSHVSALSCAVGSLFYPHRHVHDEGGKHEAEFPPASADLSALRRGTGGRSSFSGVVATVFGAGGLLGKYVVNQLGKVGTQVIIPHRGDQYDVLRLKLCGDLGQILFFPFHLKDEDSLYKVMKYSNVVINLIGRDYETSNFSFEDVHVTGPRNIARIARKLGVKRFIHVSSMNATEHPKPVILKSGSGFLASKWRGEQAVREEFPDAIIVRPADMYGPEDHFLLYYNSLWRRQLRWVPLWKNGNDTFKQPVYVADVGKGIINSVFDPDSVGLTYEAVGPQRFLLGEFVDWLYRVMKKEGEWGYKRYDMRFDPSFWFKVSFVQKFFLKYPFLTWERLERDHVTDMVTAGLPTLEDLGVKLTHVEDRIPYYMKVFKAYSYYEELTGKLEDIPPPPVVNV